MYALLEKTKLLKKLWDLHNNRTVDVITIFSEATQLDVETHFQLMKFDNVATSRYRFDWNYLRVLLLRDMPPLDTTREAGGLPSLSYTLCAEFGILFASVLIVRVILKASKVLYLSYVLV